MQRYVMRGACALVAAGLVAACTEQRFQLGVQTDTQPPTISIVVPANDTINVQNGFSFGIDATDNLGLKTLAVQFTAGLPGQSLTFTSAVTTYAWTVSVPQALTATLGGPVLITATAVDGNGNATTDTVTIYAVNPKALIVTVIRPTAGAITAPGKQLPVEVKASQVDGLLWVGWYTIPGTAGVSATDTLKSAALPDTLVIQDTLTVPANATAGQFSVIGIAMDASNRIVSTSPVLVTVQLVVNDTIGPLVTFTVPQRAEVRDSISVRARDPSGISALGWLAFDLSGAQVGGASTTGLSGTLTDVTQTYNLNLALTGSQFPAKIVIKAWATDGNGNTDSARVDTLTLGSPVLADTITVVNGVTKPLPAGGHVADAIYNPNRDEVYFTNIALDRLEVFSVTDTSFKTAIPVGSRPWGIALWPRDTLTGANADTVIVANSGGTDLSIVNVAAGAQVRRAQLPLFRVQTVHSKIDPASGLLIREITEYTTSDRPEYVGAVCRGQTCKPGGTGDVVAVYSTTPTSGQSTPLPRRGTVRWENLTSAAPESHFFWEQSRASVKVTTDTLQIYVNRGPTVPEEMILGAFCGEITDKLELGFLDTTFVRNSGNFTRAIIGEGGSSDTPALLFARALAYDVTLGVTSPACGGTDVERKDLGITPGLEVRSFIANTAIPVRAVGVNFNGLTNLVRADSIYVLDRNLRLKGLIPVGGPNWGMDLNFIHDYDPNTGASAGAFAHTPTANADRIAFVASPNPQIDVYDTYFFGKVGSIPIRDPVTGPLRVAKLPSGDQIAVGVTARGVVVVRLPAVTNTFPAPGWSGGQQ